MPAIFLKKPKLWYGKLFSQLSTGKHQWHTKIGYKKIFDSKILYKFPILPFPVKPENNLTQIKLMSEDSPHMQGIFHDHKY